MNKKSLTIGIIFILCMGLFPSTGISPAEKTTTSASDETILWLSADWHMDRNNPSNPKGTPVNTSWQNNNYMYGNAYDAVEDTSNMGVDYAFVVGDMLSWYATAAGYPDPPNGPYTKSWRRFDTVWANLTVNTEKNWTIGNHDGGWWNTSSTISKIPRSPGAGGQYYFYDFGNVRIICMADEDTRSLGSGGSHNGMGYTSDAQRIWVDNAIQSAYGNETSVFILMHQKISPSVFPWEDDGAYEESYEGSSYATLDAILSNWNYQGKPISLYACGHSHQTCVENLPSNQMMQYMFGGLHMLIGSIACYGSGGTGQPPEPRYYPNSRYLYFTPGSKTVVVKSYDHTANVFAYDKEFSFNLLWEFSLRDPDLNCNGSLSWTDVRPGRIVSGSFIVKNIGDLGSVLDWEVASYPEWGTWVIDPDFGYDLAPDDEPVTVNVTVQAPEEQETTFEGEITIINSWNESDFCTIDISLATPKNKPFNFNFNLLNWLFEQFPNAFPILRQLLKLN